MLKVENTEVSGWQAAVRGMRNPKNSWDKSDTKWVYDIVGNEIDETAEIYDPNLGDSDLNLMKLLSKAGTDHGKYLRMIHVSVDVTAPLYWWKEADQYKIGTTTNSCSTMHKIQAKEFELDDFSHEHLNPNSLQLLAATVQMLNNYRDEFNKNKCKDDWWQLIQLLPSSFNQKRTWDLDYMTLKNIYHARKSHKLDEWHTLCNWIEDLPYAKDIICNE